MTEVQVWPRARAARGRDTDLLTARDVVARAHAERARAHVAV